MIELVLVLYEIKAKYEREKHAGSFQVMLCCTERGALQTNLCKPDKLWIMCGCIGKSIECLKKVETPSLHQASLAVCSWIITQWAVIPRRLLPHGSLWTVDIILILTPILSFYAFYFCFLTPAWLCTELFSLMYLEYRYYISQWMMKK